MELIGLYFVACGLLVAAGVAKALRPGDTARALAGLAPFPLRSVRVVVRTGAIAEAALGAVALAIPRSASAWLVATSYLLFAAVVTGVRVRGGALASCGCFGTPDTPATTLHAVVDLVLALAAVSVAIAGPPSSLVALLSAQPLEGVPLVSGSALCAALAYLAVSRLAQLEAIRRVLGVSRGSVSRP